MQVRICCMVLCSRIRKVFCLLTAAEYSCGAQVLRLAYENQLQQSRSAGWQLEQPVGSEPQQPFATMTPSKINGRTSGRSSMSETWIYLVMPAQRLHTGPLYGTHATFVVQYCWYAAGKMIIRSSFELFKPKHKRMH